MLVEIVQNKYRQYTSRMLFDTTTYKDSAHPFVRGYCKRNVARAKLMRQTEVKRFYRNWLSKRILKAILDRNISYFLFLDVYERGME